MRAVTPLGPFREVGEEEYAHTRFSEEWVDSPIASLFMLRYATRRACSAFLTHQRQRG